VMRVESTYLRQIVSHAGAVGLMQIMPRTGRLISRELGVEDFDTIDLLNPRTNLEFAAWYLSSLIKRFDGRLPLAIAAYNGGPHNVRVWMSGYPQTMPLDAFLERIPFEQTHRYVRRVLTHYAAYRAQQNLPMAKLSVELPQLKPDNVAF
jgi:soluble lytic murein transglycosylase